MPFCDRLSHLMECQPCPASEVLPVLATTTSYRVLLAKYACKCVRQKLAGLPSAHSIHPTRANRTAHDSTLCLIGNQQTLTSVPVLSRKAVGRGRAARAEARDRKQKRADEEVRRAGVWGQPTDGTNKDSQEKASAASSPPTAAAVAAAKPPPRASSSLFSAGADPRNQAKTTAASSGDQPEAATRIQAAFRGGKARWEADRRREEFHLRKADAVARAQEKVRTHPVDFGV